MGDEDYIYAFQNVVMPIAYEFGPDLVMSTYRRSSPTITVTDVQSLPVSTQLKGTSLVAVMSRPARTPT
jgi:hypothetical protein